MTAGVAPLVAAGVALIEDKRPGAVALLDPAELRIASSCDCPLGQTFGSYAKGCRALRLDDFGAARHGFTWAVCRLRVRVQFPRLHSGP